MDHPHLPHLLRPARGGAAGVLVVFAVLLALAAKAGLMGIPLAFVLTSWFFKYAYFLFDHTVRGFDEPPALDISMLKLGGQCTQGGLSRGLGAHGLGLGSLVRPRSRDYLRLLPTYSDAGTMGTVVTGANRDIYVLHPLDI